jgi:ubiquinone/menaquinone biosynthesis C-methylase UbiE
VNKKHFNEYQGFVGEAMPYERKMNNPNPLIRYLAQKRISRLVEMCGSVKNKTVADIGCEVGYEALELIKRGAKVYGVDNSKDMLKIAKTYVYIYQRSKWWEGLNHGSFVPINGDIIRLPLKSNSMDVTLAGCILPHLRHPEQGLKELIRITKPGGKIILNFSNDTEILFWKKITPFLFPALEKKQAKEHIYVACDSFFYNFVEPYAKDLELKRYFHADLNSQIYVEYAKRK